MSCLNGSRKLHFVQKILRVKQFEINQKALMELFSK